MINSAAPFDIVTKADLASLLTEMARLRKDIIDLKTLMIILWAVQVLFFTGMFAGLYLLLLQNLV